MSRNSDYQLYSLRQLNPFSGVLQVVRTPAGQAVSRNGYDWQIEILTACVSDTWSGPSNANSRKSFIKFGQWNLASGLSRIPANPLLDLTQMLDDSNFLVDLLQQYAKEVPFPAVDRFELWLLDDSRHWPLVLLTSTSQKPEVVPQVEWQSLWESQRDCPDIHKLKTAIRERGRDGFRCWIERNREGEIRLLNSDIEIEVAAFPSLLLTEHWPDPEIQTLVRNYHDELAPQLLSLQHLSDEERSLLEQCAIKQPYLLENYWRIYPKIINQEEIDAARVKARLRSSRSSNEA